MSRVLVTGGCGFIGNNLVRRLHSEGYNVDVVDNMQSGDLNKLVGLPFRVIPADLIGVFTANRYAYAILRTAKAHEPDRRTANRTD